MDTGKLKAEIRSVTASAGSFLKVMRYEFETEKHAGGMQVVTREVMVRVPERGHAVAVLGYDAKRDEVVLVNEFHPGVLVAGDYPFTDNLVAGGVGEGESPLAAAVREMKEEANLDLKDPILIHPGAYVSSGGTSEKIAIVVGTIDSGKAGGIHGNSDEQEDIKTVVLPAGEFIARVRNALITDLKTLVAGYWLAENRERLMGSARW